MALIFELTAYRERLWQHHLTMWLWDDLLTAAAPLTPGARL